MRANEGEGEGQRALPVLSSPSLPPPSLPPLPFFPTAMETTTRARQTPLLCDTRLLLHLSALPLDIAGKVLLSLIDVSAAASLWAEDGTVRQVYSWFVGQHTCKLTSGGDSRANGR